jgi:manganese/zinc/iron transport system permease protein
MIDWSTFLQLDFPALAAGALAAVSCAILGCVLVLRRMSLMGDAISHAVLPGIVIAFVFTESLHAAPVFIGCAAAGIATALLSELVHRLGRVEPGASMGVVFTVLFAVGVILLEQVGGRTVHLDADCVLYGAMEGVIWPSPPQGLAEIFTADPWRSFPRQVTVLAIVLALNALFMALLFKELRLTSFDPALAASQGINPALMHYLLMTFVAITTVAAFEAVGSILVVAMLIVPALVAHLLTDRLAVMVMLSALAALAAATIGYGAAATWNVNAAGMIGVTLGGLLLITGLFAPRHGWISRLVRRAALALAIRREDMLGLLYRAAEMEGAASRGVAAARLRAAVGGGNLSRAAQWQLIRRGHVVQDASSRLALTAVGALTAAQMVRAHRLWESYLVDQLGLRADHVHEAAERLEHVTTPAMRDALAEQVATDAVDPHGRNIPPAGSRV